jgi:NTF2 fold immunity protein of polymorphic toxin system component
MVARFVTAVVLVLTGLSVRAATPLPGVGRTFGPVADEAAAIRVALTVWEPLYGKQHIASERPFRATLEHDVWHVRGTLPRGVAGGVAEADIRRGDGKVLRIMHGK